MKLRRVSALATKDLRVVGRSRALMLPMAVVPILLLVVLPVLRTSLPLLMAGDAAGREHFDRLFAGLPPTLREAYSAYTPAQAWVLLVNEQLLPPLLLLVPFVLVNVIAADSFAGERERRTLEALLYTPLTDAELFIGKVLAAWLPAIVVGGVGFFVYAAAVNAVAWPIMHRLFVPTTTGLIMVGWLAPAFSLLGLAGMILISLRVRGTNEAMQLGGLLVLPVVALLIGQVGGVLRLGPLAAFACGTVLWLLAAAFLTYGVRAFRRPRLISRI